MTYHIRVRPTALIIHEGKILFIEYKEGDRYHYNLPGGGAEPGESITDTLKRELLEEASVEIEVGPIAIVYEYFPHRQSGEYQSTTQSLLLIFECKLKEGSYPYLPDQPDENQVDVKWIPIERLNSIILYPNIRDHLIEYARTRRSIELIEDHQLETY